MFVVLEGVQHGGLQGKKNTRTKKRYKTVTVKDELRIKRECLQANSFTKNEFPSHDISNEVKTVELNRKLLFILLNWPKL